MLSFFGVTGRSLDFFLFFKGMTGQVHRKKGMTGQVHRKQEITRKAHRKQGEQ